jgi:hypothetical protein
LPIISRWRKEGFLLTTKPSPLQIGTVSTKYLTASLLVLQTNYFSSDSAVLCVQPFSAVSGRCAAQGKIPNHAYRNYAIRTTMGKSFC